MTLEKRNIKPEKLEQIAEVLKTISHPVRLEILELLEVNDKLCVSEIMEETQIEQSLLSHHLTKMKDKGILKSSRDGKRIYYSLGIEQIPQIFDCMEKCNL